MDRVRFGRALGAGTREAAKALMKAADAAKAPNSSAAAQPVRRVETQAPAQPVAQQAARVMHATANVKRESKKLRGAMLAPFVKAGSVLWLEVTGALFGLFAVVIGTWVWGHRADFAGATVAKEREWFCVAMFVAFAYFTVTSYTRAAKRGKR